MIDWIICTTSRGFDAVVDGFDWLADSRIVNAIAVLLFVVFVAPPLFLIGCVFWRLGSHRVSLQEEPPMISYRLILNGGEPQIVEAEDAWEALSQLTERGDWKFPIRSVSIEPADAPTADPRKGRWLTNRTPCAPSAPAKYRTL